MKEKRQPCRYAHSAGSMDLCYSEDGKCIITCGRDGDVRVWAGFEDDDPISHSVGESAFSLQQKDQKLYVANESSVQILTFPEGERDGILTKYPSPVTHMLLSPDSNLMIITLQNMEIRVIDLSTNSISNGLKGIDGCPLGIAFCPADDLVAVSSGDGFLRVWNLENEKIVKKINCVPKTNCFESASILCRSSFLKVSTSTTLFAYPDHKKVVILHVKEWKHFSLLTNDKVNGNFSICLFGKSKNEPFLASSTNCGDIFVWKVSDKSLLHYSIHPAKTNICAMAWSPHKVKEIAFGDARGQLGIVTLIIDNDYETEEETNITQLQEFLMHNSEIIDTSPQREKNTDYNIDDHLLDNKSIIDINDDDLQSIVSNRQTFQSPFQPSSSDRDSSGNCYMVWNSIGIIREMSNEKTNDDVSSIETDFHDSTFHHNLNTFNSNKFSMASLSRTAVIMGSQENNMFTCTPLESGGKQWSMTLDQGEDILCVAATNGYVAIGTDLRLFRIFSIHGTQCGLYSIPGPIVSMVGDCQYSNKFLVIYHDSRDCLKMQKFEENDYKFVNETISIPLLANCQLKWLGFTNQTNSPAISDSADNVRIYNKTINAWVPIINTLKQVPENQTIFVTEIDETFGIRCVLYSKNDILSVSNRPLVTELKISLPLLNMASEKSQLEEYLLINGRNSLIFDHDEFTEANEKKIAKNVLKLFAIACRSDCENQAYELIQMNLYKNLKYLAAKYASQLGYAKLADKLVETESLPVPVLSTNRLKDIERATKSSPIRSAETNSSHSLSENHSQVLFSDCSLTPTQPAKVNPFLKRNQTIENEKPKLMTKLLNESATSENGSENSKLTFVDWLTEAKKQAISIEFPNLKPDEVIVEALKQYKRIYQKRKQDSTDQSSLKKTKLI